MCVKCRQSAERGKDASVLPKRYCDFGHFRSSWSMERDDTRIFKTKLGGKEIGREKIQKSPISTINDGDGVVLP